MRELLLKIREFGYSVELLDNQIKLTWEKNTEPEQEKVIPFLNALKRNKGQAIEELRREIEEKKPYLDQYGDLVIPTGCDPKYHWWNGGQSISDTINELQQEQNDSLEGVENCRIA
jgi:hypothetical protein